MLAIEKSGAGIPLVFLHAFPLSRKMWDAHSAAFAKNFQFISIDFPGFGESPLAQEATSMDDVATAVHETLLASGVKEKIVLTGLSMGGYAAFRYLAKYPEHLRALALCSTRATPDTAAAREKRMENIALIEKEGLKTFSERMVQGLLGETTREQNPAALEQVQKWILEADPKAVIAALRGMASRPDSSGLLPETSVPTLVLAGEEDTVTPAAEMEQMAAQMKKADFQVILTGHLSAVERPPEFQNALLTFLKRRVL